MTEDTRQTIRTVIWLWKPDDFLPSAPNFKASEMVDSTEGYPFPMDVELLRLLQRIRNKAGKEVHINSARRSPSKNASTPGAASSSMHIPGMAADIRIDGLTPVQVAGLALALGTTGIGVAQGFTHVDVRVRKLGDDWVGWEYLKNRHGTKPMSETIRHQVITEAAKWK